MAFSVLEKTTQLYTANFVDETGVGIPSASLNTLTMTLYDAITNAAINARSTQNILNANNVTVSSSGLLTWTMQPNDNAILNAGLAQELHFALFQWTWTSGTSKAGKHQAAFSVVNLANVA